MFARFPASPRAQRHVSEPGHRAGHATPLIGLDFSAPPDTLTRHDISGGNGTVKSYRKAVEVMRRNSVREPSRVALVRIHAGHAALCDLEDAVAQAGRVCCAKVASIFTQPLADAGST